MRKAARRTAADGTVPKRGRKDWGPKTWVQIAKLSDEALQALKNGNPQQAIEVVRAIRGVALAADADGV
jgi:hypothetical protein